MLSKIRVRYSGLPIQVKASVWFLICAFLQKGISFISTPIFTRILNTTEFGQFNQFVSWQGLLTVVVSLQLYGGVYARGLVKFENEKDRFSSSLQGLTLTLISFGALIYLFFQDTVSKYIILTTPQMLMLFSIMWTTAVFSFWSMSQRIEFRYRSLVIITILVALIKPLVSIILVINSADKVTARIFGITVVELIFFVPLFITQMKRGKCFYDSKFWKHAILFNLPLVPHYLSMTALNGADKIMIGRMINDSAAGIYSLAYSVSMVMALFNTALIQTFEPWLYKKINSNEIGDISKVAYPAFGIIALVNILLIAFAPEAVAFFAPKEYYDAIYVIPPVAMSVYFMFSYTFFAVFEFYFEKTKFVAFASIAGAFLNVVLNYIFIQIFGYYAAGYTTLFCYMVYAIGHYLFMRKICQIYLNNNQPYSIKVLLLITISFMLVGFVLLFSYTNLIVRYGLIVIMVFLILYFRSKIMESIKLFISTRKVSKTV